MPSKITFYSVRRHCMGNESPVSNLKKNKNMYSPRNAVKLCIYYVLRVQVMNELTNYTVTQRTANYQHHSILS